MKTCIITTCDRAYLKYAIALISSCKRNTTGHIDAILRFVDEEPPPEILHCYDVLIEDKTALCTDRNILAGGFDIDHPRNTTNNTRDKLVSEKQLYCTHSKYRNCLEAFDMGYTRVFVSDADTIIRRDIMSHPALDTTCDIMMKKTSALSWGEYQHPHVFEEGFFVVNNTVGSKRLMRNVIDALSEKMSSKDIHIDSDTILIGNEIHAGDLEYVELPDELKDETCQDESYVWSGRAAAKSTNKYIQELHIYL